MLEGLDDLLEFLEDFVTQGSVDHQRWRDSDLVLFGWLRQQTFFTHAQAEVLGLLVVVVVELHADEQSSASDLVHEGILLGNLSQVALQVLTLDCCIFWHLFIDDHLDGGDTNCCGQRVSSES